MTSKYDNLYWDDIKNENYDNIMEDLEHNMIKLDDGTTIFNVFLIGQAVAHDMIQSQLFDEEDSCAMENDIIDFIVPYFQDIIDECMEECKRKLWDNGICSQVVIE